MASSLTITTMPEPREVGWTALTGGSAVAWAVDFFLAGCDCAATSAGCQPNMLSASASVAPIAAAAWPRMIAGQAAQPGTWAVTSSFPPLGENAGAAVRLHVRISDGQHTPSALPLPP